MKSRQAPQQQQRQKPNGKRHARRNAEDVEIAELIERCQDPAVYVQNQELVRFDELPISSKTLEGLTKANYIEMTEIQRTSLGYSLCGKDVLGAAKTGSGKTLAFLIPVLEALYREKWTQMDGLGALVISPTRELALQIFEVLRKVGKFHTFSAGLLIGGKDVKSEKERIGRMNILVTTPGRLLQHMDETPDFICDNLKVLVLDEADRCLDCGFERTLNAIVENLPRHPQRQTLLFSATQTKSVRDLARLSLKDPEYVAVHEASVTATPQRLQQRYVVCELPQKLDILYSFIRTHLKCKVLVFLSSCKQVRFVHETFCKMQPGIPLLCLHGKQKQPKRLAIFEQFCRKKNICLFATDIAARGLDFPAVDWVIQVDCPEDVDTYIHRVGRTARYESTGNALLLLLPSEEKGGFVDLLKQKKIPIDMVKINPEKLSTNKGGGDGDRNGGGGRERANRNKSTKSVSKMLQALCSQDPEVKYLAQKAFISYMRSVYLQKNKSVFDVHALPAKEYAESLGLPGAPKIKFVKKRDSKNNSARALATQDNEDDDTPKEGSNTAQPTTKVERLFKKKNLTVLSEHYQKLIEQSDDDEEDADKDREDGAENSDAGGDSDGSEDEDGVAVGADKAADDAQFDDDESDDDGDFLKIKTRHPDVEAPNQKQPIQVLNKRQLLKAKQKELASRGSAQKFVFDEEGNAVATYKLESLEEYTARLAQDMATDEGDAGDSEAAEKAKKLKADAILKGAAQKHAETVGKKMAVIDEQDKQVEKEKRRLKRLEKKLKLKELRRELSSGVQVTLGNPEGSADEFSDGQYEGESGASDDEEIGRADSDFEGSDTMDHSDNVGEDDEEEFGVDIDLDEEDVSVPRAGPTFNKKRGREEQSEIDEEEEKEEEREVAGKKKRRKAGVEDLGLTSTENLEELALKLLGR
ncbi:ATP-dependent RNA helicase dbp4 [Quaeritorhiza haematococci]|nr:ATP-dependent RNA helicase dbp4 [Quaeritorhiza haematococci]